MNEDNGTPIEELARRAALYGANSRRVERSYRSAVCPICGKPISEGCYSGVAGNFKKHVASCEKKKGKP